MKKIYFNLIRTHINEICNLFGIMTPSISFVPALMVSKGLIDPKGETIPEGSICVPPKLPPVGFEGDYELIGALHVPKDNHLIISTHMAGLNKCGHMQVVPLTGADVLFNISHELRHEHQRLYNPKLYNICDFNSEGIMEPAEIDADGFALAYIFSAQTGLRPNDFNLVYAQTAIKDLLSNGQRFKAAFELNKEYKLGSNNKLQNAQAEAGKHIFVRV